MERTPEDKTNQTKTPNQQTYTKKCCRRRSKACKNNITVQVQAEPALWHGMMFCNYFCFYRKALVPWCWMSFTSHVHRTVTSRPALKCSECEKDVPVLPRVTRASPPAGHPGTAPSAHHGHGLCAGEHWTTVRLCTYLTELTKTFYLQSHCIEHLLYPITYSLQVQKKDTISFKQPAFPKCLGFHSNAQLSKPLKLF